MTRDGYNRSLWQKNEFHNTNINLPHERYDVLIVGGGMTGVVTALSLQKKGKKCLLVEAHGLGYGTTGGTTAHLNTLLDTPYTTITTNFGEQTSKLIAEASKNVITDIEHNISEYGIQCEFERTAAILFSQDEKETRELLKIFDASHEAGLAITLENELPINTRFEKALKVNGQAKFHPIRYLHALASEFEKAGGQIITDCSVQEVKDHQDEILAITSKGNIIAEKIVFATHIPIGINILHLRCAPWRSYAMAVKLENNKYPDELIYDMKDPYHYYRSQQIDGQKYLIVGGNDHKTGDHGNTEQPFLQLLAHIHRIFNVKEITHQWSSQYFEPADGIPYIGQLPGHNENYYVATGYGGNGMIYSHIAATEITSFITTGASAYNDQFSPSRIKPVAGFTNFIGHNVDVVKHFVGKFFDAEKLPAIADISPGEGKIVKLDDTLVAISKDHTGKLHAVAPTCTHMKCHVAWNITEQSWDCPCHGARYSADGKVLTGPASHSLEPVELVKHVESDFQDSKKDLAR
jgi:glycine/D-amino acid oxidase-like deaminating enzyme/nitrite reductase/ring-hydroxylating ferredoxin subunit